MQFSICIIAAATTIFLFYFVVWLSCNTNYCRRMMVSKKKTKVHTMHTRHKSQMFVYFERFLCVLADFCFRFEILPKTEIEITCTVCVYCHRFRQFFSILLNNFASVFFLFRRRYVFFDCGFSKYLYVYVMFFCSFFSIFQNNLFSTFTRNK